MAGKFTKASLALLILAGTVGAAHATGVDMLSIQSADTTLIFKSPAVLVHQLDPTPNLVAGEHEDGLKVAHGSITRVNNATEVMAVRFKPGVGSPGATKDILTVDGKTAANKLTVKIATTQATNVDPNDGWLHATATATELDYDLNTSGKQNIAADTYTVNMQAGIWTN